MARGRKTATASPCSRCGVEHTAPAGVRNCRARHIASSAPGDVLDFAQSPTGVALLSTASAPGPLLVALIQTRDAPPAWLSAPAWERGPKGVQGLMRRIDFPSGSVSLLVRMGDREWAHGDVQAVEPAPDGLFDACPTAGDGRPIGEVVAAWLNEVAVDDDGVSALALIVEAAGLPEPVTPDATHHPHAGVLPGVLSGGAVRVEVFDRDDRLPKLPGPADGGDGDGWLPGFDPGPGPLARIPTLEVLHAGGMQAFKPGQGAPWPLRIAYEVLVDVPPRARHGGSVRLEYQLRGRRDGSLESIIWPENRPKWTRDGQAFVDSLWTLQRMSVPADQGCSAWFPIAIRSMPVREGGVLRLDVSLPPGSAKGPRILRRILRRLGTRSYPQWRAWLALAYLWDRSAVNGKWIRGTRPRAARNSAGALVDVDQRVLVDRRGAPVTKWTDPRVVLLDAHGRPVQTAREAAREPNPDRHLHPWLSVDDVMALGYPPEPGLSKAARSIRKQRMLQYLDTFNSEGLSVFEVHPDGKRWRVLPPGIDPE